MAKPIAFSFLLDYLAPLGVRVRPMFGCHMIYDEERMLFFTGDESRLEDDFGICVATTPEFSDELRREFPSLRPLTVFGPHNSGGWLVLPIAASDFEESAVALCELAVKGDPRVGRMSAGIAAKPLTFRVEKTKKKPAKRRAPIKKKKKKKKKATSR